MFLVIDRGLRFVGDCRSERCTDDCCGVGKRRSRVDAGEVALQ